MEFTRLYLNQDDYMMINVQSKKIIRILNNENLKQLHKNYNSRLLARKLLMAYRKEHRQSIAISEASLAAEILGHLLPHQFLKSVRQIPLPKALLKSTDFFLERTSIIDCGEKEVDDNRFIWDLLSKLMI